VDMWGDWWWETVEMEHMCVMMYVRCFLVFSGGGGRERESNGW
jgi:hypothetical protein